MFRQNISPDRLSFRAQRDNFTHLEDLHVIRCYYGGKSQTASLYRTSPDQAVLAALQGCHFIITISGLSVAFQLLVTLSPSQRLAPEVGLEVDTYDDSRGSHVR